jgi:NTP pyrophosphatase (non-canonical NTP hydrolase)
MNPREQFEKETGMTTGIMFAHSVGFRDEYVLWLEKLVETLLSNPEPTKLLTDDCDFNQNRLEVFTGGNGDYYVAVVVDDISHAVRIAMSGGNATTQIKLAVANLHRAMNNIRNESNPEPQKSKLQTLMDDIKNWSDATVGDSQRTIPILYHLIKEVPELIESIEKEETVRTTLFEFADCFMLLLDAASHHGYKADDILLAMSDKLEINKKRKWGEPDENGVVEHIRDHPINPETITEELKPCGENYFKKDGQCYQSCGECEYGVCRFYK